MAIKKTPKNIKFEEALAELEAAVEKLESGDLPLEEAIEEFQRGTELSKICLEKLNKAKAAVQKLVVSPVNDEDYHTEDFEAPEENRTTSFKEEYAWIFRSIMTAAKSWSTAFWKNAWKNGASPTWTML